MQQTQHTTPCQVLLHPACTTNPEAIRAVQEATGRLVVLAGGKATLQKPQPKPLFVFVSGAEGYLPAKAESRRFIVIDELDNDPFDGGSAA